MDDTALEAFDLAVTMDEVARALMDHAESAAVTPELAQTLRALSEDLTETWQAWARGHGYHPKDLLLPA